MANSSKIRTNFTKRPIPHSGPFSSNDYNASIGEISLDLITMALRWNDDLYPLLSTLPQGSYEDRWAGATNVPDPVVNGLDGAGVFVDNAASLTEDDGLFWEIDDNRPVTIKEAFQTVSADILTLQTIGGGGGNSVVRQSFSSHSDPEVPIVVTHNLGAYPFVQVVNTTADPGATFLTIEHISTNVVNVYTNATSGVVLILG